MSTRDAVLALDVGGTSTKALVVTTGGRVAHQERIPTVPGTAAVNELGDQLERLHELAGEQGLRVLGAGVVTPGLIDEPTGTVRYASNLGWRDLPLRAALQARSSIPVTTGHDVRAAGLAERLVGAARGAQDALLVVLGTGIAAALLTAGISVSGGTGAAGELGHAPVRPGGEVCPCGQLGCLEVYSSGAGVARRYATRTRVTRAAEEIVDRRTHDVDAARVWTDATAALADALVTATLLLDPSVVVIGGGLSAAGAALLDPVSQGLAAGLTWRPPPALRLSTLGPTAGCLGAAALAMTDLGLTDQLERWTGAPIR